MDGTEEAATEEPAEEDIVEGQMGPMDALARRLGRVRRRMEARGYGAAVALERSLVREGEGHFFSLALPLGRCTTAVALAGGTVRELEMRLYDQDGHLVAIDSVPGEAGLVHYCPESVTEEGDPSEEQSEGSDPRAPWGTTTAYLTLQSTQGTGGVASAAFESEPGEGEGFAELFDGILRPPASIEPVADALSAARPSLWERGLEQEGEARFVRLAEGQSARAPVTFDPSRCLVAVARTDEGLADLDVFLFGPDGTEVARDLGVDTEPQLEHCPEQEGTGTIELRAFAGAGAAGWSLWTGPRQQDTDDVLATEVRVTAPTEQLMAQMEGLRGRGFSEVESSEPERTIRPGETVSLEMALGPGCGWVLAAAEPSDVDLDLYLQGPDGTALDRDQRIRPSAQVGVCAEARTTYRVLVKAYGRGRFAVASALAPDNVRTLSALRTESAMAPLAARGFAYERTEEHHLGDGPVAVTMASGECRAVVAAGGATLLDVDLVVRDANGGRVASDRGPAPWAGVTFCAPEEGEASFFVDVVRYRGQGPVRLEWMRGS